jgi:hypothetical protein
VEFASGNYILVADLNNFKSYCHIVHHVSAANLRNLFVKTVKTQSLTSKFAFKAYGFGFKNTYLKLSRVRPWDLLLKINFYELAAPMLW